MFDDEISLILIYILGCTELYTGIYPVVSPVVGKGVDRTVCKIGLPYLVCSSYRGVTFRVRIILLNTLPLLFNSRTTGC
jgi:hypothetical protein